VGLDSTAGVFQVCGACEYAWPTWDQFVRDPAVCLFGFQAMPPELDCNLLVFEHRCGSTISVLARRLRHLLPEPQADALPLLFGTGECGGHCRNLEDLAACAAPCRNARDRALILAVRSLKAVDGSESAP